MTWASSVDEAMAVGTARYADVIGALDAAGLPTVFTQTGGICAHWKSRWKPGSIWSVDWKKTTGSAGDGPAADGGGADVAGVGVGVDLGVDAGLE